LRWALAMNRLITSLQNPRVKEAVKLREHRTRKQLRRIVIDGAREVLRALQAGVEMLEIFACEELARRAEAQQALEQARSGGTEILLVTPAVFRKLAFGDRAEGLVAVAKTPDTGWPDWELPDDPLLVVLEQVEKPGNLGGIVRTVDAVGASAVLVADAAADLYNPNAIRASLGTVFTVRLAAAPSQDVTAWLRRMGVRIFAARVDGAVTFWDADFRGPTAVVLGSEAHGLSSHWRADDITPISLPLRGQVDSLNVSAAAAAVLYEATRQRRSAWPQ